MSSWNWLFERKWPIKRWNRTFIPGFNTDLIQPPTYSYHLFYSHNATPQLFCLFRCCVLFSLSFSSPSTHLSPPPLGPILSFPVRRELLLPIVEFETFAIWPHPKLGGRLMMSAGFLGGSALKPWQFIGSESSPVPCDKLRFLSNSSPIFADAWTQKSEFIWVTVRQEDAHLHKSLVPAGSTNHKCKFITLNVVYLCI